MENHYPLNDRIDFWLLYLGGIALLFIVIFSLPFENDDQESSIQATYYLPTSYSFSTLQRLQYYIQENGITEGRENCIIAMSEPTTLGMDKVDIRNFIDNVKSGFDVKLKLQFDINHQTDQKAHILHEIIEGLEHQIHIKSLEFIILPAKVFAIVTKSCNKIFLIGSLMWTILFVIKYVPKLKSLRNQRQEQSAKLCNLKLLKKTDDKFNPNLLLLNKISSAKEYSQSTLLSDEIYNNNKSPP